MVQVCTKDGWGICSTGWVYEDGWIITAAHGLADAETQVFVSISRPGIGWDGFYIYLAAQYMGSDKLRDVAAVKLWDTGGFTFAPLPRRDIDSLGADEELVLIGQSEGLPAEAKVGVLSNERMIAFPDEEVDGEIEVIELDLSIVKGDSGGAYVDSYGRVLGIAQGVEAGDRHPDRALGLPLSEIEKVWERLKAGEQLNADLANWMHYEFEQ